ncbi:hypothetical protein LCGC14_1630240 [marine sediment metagenome]|uniref:Uncharacterized protein n=1 Tax=marine sediment metagenome TaxID=412755 RepID=A0A0F9L2H5_9ZZZZ
MVAGKYDKPIVITGKAAVLWLMPDREIVHIQHLRQLFKLFCGMVPAPGDATWIYSEFDTESWAAPGGDFESTESSMIMISGNGKVKWGGSGLVEDIGSNLRLDRYNLYLCCQYTDTHWNVNKRTDNRIV